MKIKYLILIYFCYVFLFFCSLGYFDIKQKNNDILNTFQISKLCYRTDSTIVNINYNHIINRYTWTVIFYEKQIKKYFIRNFSLTNPTKKELVKMLNDKMYKIDIIVDGNYMENTINFFPVYAKSDKKVELKIKNELSVFPEDNYKKWNEEELNKNEI